MSEVTYIFCYNLMETSGLLLKLCLSIKGFVSDLGIRVDPHYSMQCADYTIQRQTYFTCLKSEKET